MEKYIQKPEPVQDQPDFCTNFNNPGQVQATLNFMSMWDPNFEDELTHGQAHDQYMRWAA